MQVVALKEALDIVAVDSKRLLAHFLPGFILYIGILITYDSLLADPEQRFTTGIFLDVTPNESNLTLVLSLGFFIGVLLGLMIDSIGHRFFEECICNKWLTKNKKIEEEKSYLDLARNVPQIKKALKDNLARIVENPDGTITNPIKHDDLYAFINDVTVDQQADPSKDVKKVAIRDYLMNQFYSYFEFYQNAGIALGLVSFAFPSYLTHVLGYPKIAGLITFVVLLAASGLLLVSAAHTLRNYRDARFRMIGGAIRNKYLLNETKNFETTTKAAAESFKAAGELVKAAKEVIFKPEEALKERKSSANLLLTDIKNLRKVAIDKAKDAETLAKPHSTNAATPHTPLQKTANATLDAAKKTEEVATKAEEMVLILKDMINFEPVNEETISTAAKNVFKAANNAQNVTKAAQEATTSAQAAAIKVDDSNQKIATSIKDGAMAAAEAATALKDKISEAAKIIGEVLVAATKESIIKDPEVSAENATKAAFVAINTASKVATKTAEMIDKA